MIDGSMQPFSLTLDKFLLHAAKWHPDVEVITAGTGTTTTRMGYAALRERALQVSQVLAGLGVGLGSRVATLAWNTARHLEVWYGITGIGAIYHTVNPRLFPEQIAWIVNHAADRVLFTDLTFLPILEALRGSLPDRKSVV